MSPRIYGCLSLFAGGGGKTLGVLRTNRFESVGAFDIDPEACADFERLTGAKAQALDIGALTPAELARRCTRRPDMVVMSPPCQGFSGCLPEANVSLPRYQKLNALALYSLDLVLEAWSEPPAIILLENVPRMLTRGRETLERAKALLRAKGYAVDVGVHDCGELGGLAQTRKRVLLVARLERLAPTSLLRPPSRPKRAMADVLWGLPVPIPGSDAGGRMHALPKLSALNWARLAAIRAGEDWRSIPEAIELVHRSGRQNGGFGVNDARGPGHTVVAEGSVRNTWAAVTDPRLGCAPRAGTMGVETGGQPAHTLIGRAGVHNSWATIADPRSVCHRREGSLGVCSAASHLYTSVIAKGQVHNGPWQIADPRVCAQHRGNFGVQDPARPSAVSRATHVPRTAPASVADGRPLFVPTHRLIAGQGLDVDRSAWVSGRFRLEGPPVDLAAKGRPCHLVILAPDGTIHRPLTTLELAVLQGFPAWHRPGDPTELELGAEGGQWLELTGDSSGRWRQRIGNAVPPRTAQVIAAQAVEVLDAGASEEFRLSSSGVWVEGERDQTGLIGDKRGAA